MGDNTMFRNLARKLRGRRHNSTSSRRQKNAKRKARQGLLIESLEDRTLLTTTITYTDLALKLSDSFRSTTNSLHAYFSDNQRLDVIPVIGRQVQDFSVIRTSLERI